MTYRSDGAKELISSDILKFLASQRTKLTYSPPYTAELNSLIERNYRTTFEMAHAMLLKANLPLIFWEDAVEYASLIFNSVPTTTSSGLMPPITAKYGIIPDLKVFKIFGCIVYVHIPKETRSKGFVDKAYRGFFLGINLKTSTYRGYVIELDKVVDDSSMIFDETMTNQLSNNVGILEFATDSASIKDYMYMIDMIYRDTEDSLLYVTTRVVIRGGLLVAFRALYLTWLR